MAEAAAEPAQLEPLLGELDPLGDNLELQRLAQRDDGGREGRGVRRGAVAQEGAVHLEDVDREAAQVAER